MLLRKTAKPPAEADVAKLADTLGAIEDDGLRTALARLGASIKRN